MIVAPQDLKIGSLVVNVDRPFPIFLLTSINDQIIWAGGRSNELSFVLMSDIGLIIGIDIRHDEHNEPWACVLLSSGEIGWGSLHDFKSVLDE